jgi:hypothetical protein
MVEEFDLPMEIIDRKVTKMKMISPSNREVDVGKTLSETEWIGMCRREVFDDFLRNRAKSLGANLLNGLMMKMEMPEVGTAACLTTSQATTSRCHGWCCVAWLSMTRMALLSSVQMAPLWMSHCAAACSMWWLRLSLCTALSPAVLHVQPQAQLSIHCPDQPTAAPHHNSHLCPPAQPCQASHPAHTWPRL